MYIGKSCSERYSLLIHLKYFETCTVLFSGFLENEMDVLVTILYKNCNFGACGTVGMAIAGKMRKPCLPFSSSPACGCALDRLLWQGCVQCASRGKGSWNSDRESSQLCQPLMSLFSPLSPWIEMLSFHCSETTPWGKELSAAPYSVHCPTPRLLWFNNLIILMFPVNR